MCGAQNRVCLASVSRHAFGCEVVSLYCVFILLLLGRRTIISHKALSRSIS